MTSLHSYDIPATAGREANPVTSICPVCSGFAARDPFYYEWHGKRWDIHRCADCTHQYVFPQVTAADQNLIYADQYFAADGDWIAHHVEKAYHEAHNELRSEARAILNLLEPHTGGSGALLDIGCAGGVFLDVARHHGYDVQGIELNAKQAADAREKFGLNVHTLPIEEAHSDIFAAGSLAVVTLNDVLEHLPRPAVLFSKLSSWLQPGGIVFVRGPLANSRLGRAKETARRLVSVDKQLPGYPLDANMFNKMSLTRLATRHGFEVVGWFGAAHDFANCVMRRVAMAN